LTRIYLVTPRDIDLATFPGQLEEALAGGDVASLLIAPENVSEMALQRIAEVLTPIGQAAGTAVIVRDDTRASGRAKADGIHIETGVPDLEDAVESFHPGRIVGAGNIKTRHDAMEAAEIGADYIFFGNLGRPEEPDTNPKSLDFADWWVPLFEPPCVVMAGSTLASIDEVAETGADFVAVRDAIWLDPRGARVAIAEVERRLTEIRLMLKA
jgi:thiamine-phosphate pyrophosphorylase